MYRYNIFSDSRINEWQAQEFWADQSCSTEGRFQREIGCPKYIDQRWEVWRWIGYAFVHVDFEHVYFNAFFELLLGPSLEMVHGHTRFIPLSLMCILGGALANGMAEPTGRVVGSSGYLWGLVPMHVLTSFNKHIFNKHIFFFISTNLL